MFNKYKIYVDMDGVLVDWEKSFAKISNGLSADAYEAQHGSEARFNLSQNSSPEFYANMEWMSDGKQLYDFVKNLNSEILSHAESDSGKDTRVIDGKNTWLKNNNIKIHANLVHHREDKASFASENSILIDDREDNIIEFEEAGGIGILHKNATDTIKKLKEIMNINDTHRVYNSILNPAIMDENQHIKQDVMEKLLEIAKLFYKDSEIEAPIHDIILVGSSIGYNWTTDSDIDLHVLIDFEDVDENKEIVKKLVDKIKNDWNNKHDIKIKNHEVEVYIQDIQEENKSESVFSILKNQWLKKPVYQEPVLNKLSIKRKYESSVKKIDDLLQNPDEDKLKNVLKDLYKMRQSGLDKNGEYSTENIVFKILRKKGYMDKIRDCIIHLTDDKFSIKQ